MYFLSIYIDNPMVGVKEEEEGFYCTYLLNFKGQIIYLCTNSS